MSEPFIFIGTHTIREGKLEDFKKSCGELLEVVEANEPRLIAFNFYANEDRHGGDCRPGPPGRGLHAVPHAGGPRAHQRGVPRKLLEDRDMQTSTERPATRCSEMIKELSQGRGCR